MCEACAGLHAWLSTERNLILLEPVQESVQVHPFALQ